jgi:hypothetical protein
MLVLSSYFPLTYPTLKPFRKCELITYSIVLGDINGQLQAAFKKLTTLHEKNKFSLAIVAGNLFSEDNDSVSGLLTGTITLPLPTYFTVGTSPLPQRIIDKIEKDEEVSLHSLLFICYFLTSRRSVPTSTFWESEARPKLSKESRSLHWVGSLMKRLLAACPRSNTCHFIPLGTQKLFMVQIRPIFSSLRYGLLPLGMARKSHWQKV